MGAIVFDIRGFNWDQAATSHRSLLTAPWFPSVRGDSRAIRRTLGARFPFRGKSNWLLTRHCFALASFPIGLTIFPLPVMDPRVKGSRRFWVPLMRFCTQVHYPAHIWQVWVNIWESLFHLLDSSPGYGLCVYSIFSNYIVAGCSPEVTWTTIWNCGRSFHKIGVVQKFHAAMEITQKEKKW